MTKHYSSETRPAQLNREIAAALATRARPSHPSTHCYACDAEAHGIRDRRPEGGSVEAACARHAGQGSRGGAWEDLKDEPSLRRREQAAKKPSTRTKKSATRARPAHAPRASGLAAYRSLVKKAIARCSKHPRPNHSLYECVFEEVHGGAPYPTPQMRRILEDAVHTARPASNLHARKKKLDPHAAKQRLKMAGIDFSRDFHQLPSSQVDLILDTARAAGYRKRKDAPGSTARMYFQYLKGAFNKA